MIADSIPRIAGQDKRMKIVDAGSKISLEELKEMANATFGDLVKAVVDIKRATVDNPEVREIIGQIVADLVNR